MVLGGKEDILGGNDIRMPSGKASVLVVDDDVHILRMIQRILELEGYRVLTASNGEAAFDILDKETPCLVLLDIKMPGVDGYTVCRRIREFSQIPIIMVTVKGNDAEKVQGLDAGADDYVTKPFAARELVARIRAVLRRVVHRDERSEPVFRSNDLIIEFARHRVILDSEEVNLTGTEYRLLSYMAGNANRVVTPDQILEKIWDKDYISGTHILQVNMNRLRRKLRDDARNPRHILTRPGLGYMMVK